MTTSPDESSPGVATAAHPLLGRPTRVELHRYQPEQSRTLSSAEDVGAFAAALGVDRGQAASVARTMPAAEMVFFDHAGAPIATVVFLSADDVGVVSVRERGTSALTASESAALRALLARHLP
jgi:hypothetical protein